MKHPLVALLLFVGCTPMPVPEPPEPPPADTAHCAESCEQLQALKCKRGSDEVCAVFDDETGECAATKTCVEACHDDPHAYPRGVVEICP